MNTRGLLLAIPLLVTACASTSTAEPATAPTILPALAAAVADPARPVADVQRDPDRKPAALIAFAGLKPGDRIADVIPGGGYFTRLFSKLVGPQGRVDAVVPASIAAAAPQKLDSIRAIAADPAYGNVALDVTPLEQIGEDGALDMVWTSDNYHDVYGAVGAFVPAGATGPAQAAALDSAVFKALKPGGHFIVIDHAAKAGADGSSAKSLHRIDPAIVIQQVQAAGFVLEARSDVVQNAADTHEEPIFSASIRGHTDQFVLRFRKPSR